MLEKEIKKNAVQTFQSMGYEAIPSYLFAVGDGEKSIDFIFRQKISLLNLSKLRGLPLTDTEFKRLALQYPKTKEDAFKLIRNGIILLRDDNTKVHLEFIDRVTPENNTFQVGEELLSHGIGLKDNRFDLIVYINGIPLVDIELKSPTSSVQEAIVQINRYTSQGSYSQGLLRFIQLFVVSNDVDNRYFCADPRADKGKSYGEQVFTWLDKNNKPTRNVVQFIKEFFEPTHLIRAIFDYMLLLPSNDGDRYVIMRPNQIHAVNAVCSSLNIGMDTYVSASTGSGKTLTSFKLSQILASEGKKVIMVLDRNDLADQTASEFLKFDTTGLVKEIKKGIHLHRAMMDEHEKLVITTIQSLYRWVKRYKKSVSKLADQRNAIFVVDECHRSTSGTYLTDVKRAFYDEERGYGSFKCKFVGFTGTPLLEENASSLETMTQNVFGEPSHIYTITEAIRDKTVLPFKTFTINISADDEVDGMRPASYYEDERRMRAIAQEISYKLKSHTKQLDRVKTPETMGFSAMLATNSKSSAMGYWRTLRTILAKQNRKTAVIFSIDPNGSSVDNDENRYLEILEAWDEEWGTSLREVASQGDFSGARMMHLKDVITKTRAGFIDLLIVSDMLLTGFDAPSVNTIYLDKSLEHHGLLQACSRTNRLNGTNKTHGNIVFFSDRNLDERLRDAIFLFGTAENIEEVIDTTSYKEMEELLRKSVHELKSLASSPHDMEDINSRMELMRVTKAYRSIVSNLNRIKSYPEWNEEEGYSRVGTEQDELEYYHAFIEVARERIMESDPSLTDEEREADEINFSVSTVNGEVIDLQYIMNLLNNFIATPPSERDRWIRKAEKIINSNILPEIAESREALDQLIEACKNGEIANVEQLFGRLHEEQSKIRTLRLQDYSEEWNVSIEFLEFLILNKKNNKIMGYFDMRAPLLQDLKNRGIEMDKSERRKLGTEIREKLSVF